MGIKTNISKLHYKKDAKGILFNALKFCALFYGIGSGLKNLLYDKGILKPKKVDAYVISVGNLTTGGVGKTPVVAQIANYLIEQGEKIAIVSRGYGGKLNGVNIISDGKKVYFEADKSGDEPRWLAENSKAVVITSPKRYEGAKLAVEKFECTKIILDDGFQHRKLHRDLDIVLVDSEKGFGNENLLPAGPLREGFEVFSRIDKLVVVSKNIDHTRAEKFAKVMGKKLKKDTSVCYTEPDFAYNILDNDDTVAVVGWACQPNNENKENVLEVGRAYLPDNTKPDNAKFLAFSAIGQPEQFYKFLKDLDVIKTVDFDDHHSYTQNDVTKLEDLAKNIGATKLVTTEKDAAKLVNLKTNLPIYALKLKTTVDVENLLAI